MRATRRRISAALVILLAVLLAPQVAGAKPKEQKEYQGHLWNFKKTARKTSGAFTFYAYPSKSGKEAWIYKIGIRGGRSCSRLSVPSRIGGRRVTRLGSREVRKRDYDNIDDVYNIFDVPMEPWHPYANGDTPRTNRIKKLVLPDTVRVIQPTAFGGLDSVEEVRLPKSVQKLPKFAFYHCDKLRRVDLPKSLKSLDILAFQNCPELSDVRLSSKNKTYQVRGKCLITRKKKELVYAATGGGRLEIPEGVKVLKPYAFMNCVYEEVHVPASVRKIEGDTFADHGLGINAGMYIGNVTVDEKNGTYARDGQCIYNKKDKSLAVAIWDESRVLYISERVERMTGDRNIIDSKLPEYVSVKGVYPKNFKTVVDVDLFFVSDSFFMGEKPPKMVKEKRKAPFRLPIGIYVPEGSKKAYVQWFKKHKQYDKFAIGGTFRPENIQDLFAEIDSMP